MAGQEILLALSGFKLRDKFSDEAWLERGLNPSAAPVSEKLASIFNHVSDELIKEAEDSAASKSFKKILKKNLSQISIDDFDTEEREFICDLFMELSQIAGVILKKELQHWLYGQPIGAPSFPSDIPYGSIESFVHLCTKCGAKLRSHVLQKQDGLPEMDWIVAQCNACGNYELIDLGAGILSFKFDKLEVIEWLPRSKYAREQALDRVNHLNQHKHD